MSESFSIPTPGDVISGKYRVMEELGRGAYGVVFRAEQEGLGRSVALKTLLPQAFLQQDIVQRFEREAQLISRLDHKNVIKLYDYGVDEGLLFMAVEYVEGRTLSELIKSEAPIAPSKARGIALQIAEALAYAHSRGVVHRDLKPDNILLLRTRTGESDVDEVVKILDFGIAKLVLAEHEEGALNTLTQDGTVLGTPHYMSPENIVGDAVDHRTDIYALGVILYEMLVGDHPFEAPSPSAVMVRHLRDDPPHLPAPLDGSALDRLLQDCLEKQPEDRLENAEELVERLRSLEMPARDVPVKPPTPAQTEAQAIVEASTSSRSAQPGGLGVIAVLLVLLIAAAMFKMYVDSQGSVAPAVEPPVQTPTLEPQPVADVGGAAPAPDAGSAVPEPEGFEFGEDEVEEPSSEGPSTDEPIRAAEPGERGKRGPRSSRDTEKPRREAKVEQVTITVRSQPQDAIVTIDGRAVGMTPVERSWAKGEAPIKVRVSLLGYKNQVFEILPDQDRTVDARLEFERIKMFE